MALPCGHALCEGCFGRIPGGALLVDGQRVGAAPRPAEDARASEAQDRDATRQRHAEAEDAAARREAVERSRREAAEERERQREAAAARAEEVQCVICQEAIRGGDQRLPCAHVFHRACLQRWLPEHRSCPVCRTPVSAAEQSAAAPARPTERGRDDPNAALYARLQAQHEEHNRAAARERPSAYNAAFAVNQRGGGAAATTAQPGHSSPQPHWLHNVLLNASDQIWYIEKHDGSRYVQHNHADGTYECYARGSATHIVDRGRYSMVNGQYSEANFEGSRGSLQSDGASVWIDHHAGVHGYHKYIATSDQYKGGILESSWGAGAATTAQPGHSSPQPGGRRTDGLISTDEIAGCWVSICFPIWLGIFSTEVTGPDSLKHCYLVLPFFPFQQHRIRYPGTNAFYLVGNPQDVDHYSSNDCLCNGPVCGMKVC